MHTVKFPEILRYQSKHFTLLDYQANINQLIIIFFKEVKFLK